MRQFSCSRLSVLAASAAMLFTAASAHATDSCYFGGPLLPNYTLNGSATMDGKNILVTPNQGRLNSSVFFNPAFSTSGDLHIKMAVQITTTSTSGADGVAFVMHNSPDGPKALGNPGDCIGYGDYPGAPTKGISPSVVVELDTYDNSYFGDPSNDHIAITRGGNSNHEASGNIGLPVQNLSGTNLSLKNNKLVYLWVDYTASKTLLDVYLSDSDSRPASPLLTTNAINLATELGSQFYMGFTGSTGNEWSEHRVLELRATDSFTRPEQACCDSDSDCTGSPRGNVCDTAKHTCGECTLDNTSQCAASHMSCALEGANNRCVEACDGDRSAGTAHACSAEAFPVCVSSGPLAGSCSSCNGDSGTGASFRCNAKTPYCSSKGYCGYCTSNADCTVEGVAHGGPICNRSTGVCGSTCQVDSDCGGGAWCNPAGACIPKTPNGEWIPGGTCTEPQSVRTCQSGVCETADNVCGLVNGTAVPTGSAAGQVCRAGVSDADGRCGLRNGTVLPTGAAAQQVCRGGVADADGRCGLVNGTALPTGTTAEQVCRSGTADADARCGLVNGTALPTGTTAEQVCRSGVAELDGRCGLMNETVLPTGMAAEQVCRSGVAELDGRCGLVNGTALPTGTSAEVVCRGGVAELDGRCGLVNGTALPNDAAAVEVCRVGVADMDGRCGLVNGTGVPDWLVAEQACRSGVADADGRCGLADGST
ncbi:L-type lectin-domain containing protein, partial [Archangium sp.]|uniref:L-type lectin-domain containing protein n=1 Tax=Archangium sp. TaxID=1872627 RepID=UPI00389A082E